MGAGLIASFTSSSAFAQISDNVVRISILNDMTGIYADAGGKGSIVAAELAAEDFGGKVAGAKIEVVSGDHANKPDVASNLARKAYDAEGVDVIADGGSSAAALAMQNVSREKKKIILLSGPATAEITGKSCSPYSFHWMYDTYALAAAPPQDVLRRGGERFWDKMGRPPSIVQAGVYSSVVHYLKAVAATNTDDATKVADKMREMPVEDAFTHGANIRADGRLLRDLYVTEVKKPEESKGPWDYWKIIATIPGDKAWRPVDESECPLLKTH